MTGSAAQRHGVVSKSSSKITADLASIASEVSGHRAELLSRAESLIQASIEQIRGLRVAGMINKTGSENITNDLILAMQALDELK